MKGRESNREDRKREVIICLWDREKSGIMNLSGSQKTFISAAKYEQIVNMPNFTFKKPFFRIFWKILAKTGPQPLYLCGFPEASVEMKVAPFRALTQKPARLQILRAWRGGNEGRPFQGIDTRSVSALPRFWLRRNEGRPFQGIDTFILFLF